MQIDQEYFYKEFTAYIENIFVFVLLLEYQKIVCMLALAC